MSRFLAVLGCLPMAVVLVGLVLVLGWSVLMLGR